MDSTQEHQKVLEQLVDMLTRPPVLAYPDFDQSFILHADVSEQGLVTTLYQQQDGKLQYVSLVTDRRPCHLPNKTTTCTAAS